MSYSSYMSYRKVGKQYQKTQTAYYLQLLPDTKGFVMQNSLRTETSLIAFDDSDTYTSDPGLVTFCDENDTVCMIADRFCPLAETLCEKERMIKEQQDKLEESEIQIRHLDGLAKLGELSAVVAHEIRNPLTGISATAEMLLEDMDAGDPRRESVNIIIDEIQRLEKTVCNLLGFARNHKPFITKVDMREQIERVLAAIEKQARQQQVSISGKCITNVPDALADPDLIQKVFLNMAINAVQAMPDGGELAVTLYTESDERGKWVRIAFTDTGCGISPDSLVRIFDPFFTTKSTGAGLGLAVCRKTVEALRGYITVRSETGKGSTFIVSLPAA